MLNNRWFGSSSMTRLSLWVNCVACLILGLLLLLHILLLLLVILLLRLLILRLSFLLNVYVIFWASSFLFGVGHDKMRSRIVICWRVDLPTVQITYKSTRLRISSVASLVAGVGSWCCVRVVSAVGVLVSVAVLTWCHNYILDVVVDR